MRQADWEARRRIGKKIRARREAAGLSQEDLAKKLGVSQTYVSHLEKGLRSCREERLVSIPAALGWEGPPFTFYYD